MQTVQKRSKYLGLVQNAKTRLSHRYTFALVFLVNACLSVIYPDECPGKCQRHRRPTNQFLSNTQTKLPASFRSIKPSLDSLASLLSVSALCLGVLNPEVWNSLDSLASSP